METRVTSAVKGADATFYSVYSGSHGSVSAEQDTSRMCRELSGVLWDWAWKDRNNQFSMSCCLWLHARKTAGKEPTLHPTSLPCYDLHITCFYELIFSAVPELIQQKSALHPLGVSSRARWGEDSATPLAASTFLNKAVPLSLQPHWRSAHSSLKPAWTSGSSSVFKRMQDTWKSNSFPLGTI